ncbi:MAG: alpha/beta hydrolase [Actinomycetota bacterium]
MTTLTAAAASDLFRRAPDRMIDVGAGEVAVRTVGTGPDVVFVHGFPVSGATFRGLLPHLVEHVTCHVIDLPGAGSSSFDDSTEITLARHIESIRRVVDGLGLDRYAAVGFDSGGLITRHAVVDDPRLYALGLIDTEPEQPGFRFVMFGWNRFIPGIGRMLGWISGHKRLRKNGFVFGDAFVDRSLLDGEFEEFFLVPLNESVAKQRAAGRVFKSFDYRLMKSLPDIHARIDVPTQLVWGVDDKFFPVETAREMVKEFPNAELTEISGAGLFSHEEKPAEVAAALLPVLTGAR